MCISPFYCTISLQLYRMLRITATYTRMILSICTNMERRRQQSSSCLFIMFERSQRRQQRQRRRRRFIDYETVVLLPVVVLYLFVVVSSFPIRTTTPTKSSLLFFECDNPTWWCAIRNQCTTTPATCNRHVPRATLGDKDGNKDNNSNTIDDHTSSIRSSHNSDGGFKIRELREEDLGVVSTILADSFLIQETDGTSSSSSFSVAGVWNSFTNYIEKMDVGLALKSRYETFKFADRSSDGNSLQQCFLVAYTSNNKSNTNNNNNTHEDEIETIVGSCEVDNRPPREERDPAPRPYISSLAVARKYRRNGVATALITKSEAMVRTRFLRTEAEPQQYLYLQVLVDNVAAKDLYLQKCGYTLVSQKLNAKKETLLLLTKEL